MEKIKIRISCPHCESMFKEKLENIKPGNSKKCPSCSNIIEFTGDDASQIQKQLGHFEDELKKTFNNLNL